MKPNTFINAILYSYICECLAGRTAMSKKKEDKSCELYIGNIPSEFTKEDVENLFKKYNIVKTLGFFRSGKKTFCFIRLATDTDATNAVTEMCNKTVNGRNLKVHRNEDRRRNPKPDKARTKNSDSHHSALTPEDFIPPLETPSNSQNSTSNDKVLTGEFGTYRKLQAGHHDLVKLPTFESNLKLEIPLLEAATCHENSSPPSDSSNPMPSKTQYSAYSYSDSSQLNESRYVLQSKENSFHFQHQPKHKSTPFRPSCREEKATGHPNNNTQLSTDLNHSLDKLSEKFEYVHCSRKVISYNPRDFQNVECNNKCEYLSEPVNVQVVNFPYGTTKNQIMKLFEDFSPINAYIINNEHGCDYTQAVTTLPSMEAAEAAIMELDNTIYKRRAILVSIVDDEFDELISNYDNGGYSDEYDSYCYEPDDEYSEEGYSSRSNREQFCDSHLSRRFHNVHLS